MLVSKHYLHYIPRRVRLRGQAAPLSLPVLTELPLDFERPRYHFTGATKGLVRRVVPGDTIWLISQLLTPWQRLPPSLDARIDVASCVATPAGFRFMAAETSCWYPLADASALLPELITRRQNGQLSPLAHRFGGALGLVLQQMRELADAAPLEAWACGVAARGYDFVSYRLRDGTRPAFTKIEALLAAQKPVFWDRWSLPRQLAEAHGQADDALFKAYLARMIGGADTVWGISTPAYDEPGCFAAFEQATAQRHGNFVRWPAVPQLR